MRKLLTCSILFWLAGCQNIEKSPKPDDFYGDDKMIEIMTDLYLMEASMTTNRVTFTDLKVLPHEFIYDKYETDSLTFAENLEYYTDRNDKYLELMEQVKTKMEVLRDTIDANMRTPKTSGPASLEPKVSLEKDPDND
ncbi:hypothetical protein AAU57_04220 [Nonlabens sp. YIK11]|uniref:DUF4296 domain-containing protein n=1 Tax=Nonlabens sp. YIK11 TaxID=1453349 RepID=UPI0006DC379D|nr:DUF4296 domain-containing protein [Nonlabens sp. YIK11]KQC32619.1 hypothetical protein AAU57_04220 [Nonlabens sp. YIK11]